MNYKVSLSGEIHSDWRDKVREFTSLAGLDIVFYCPVTNHAASDDCGGSILGAEDNKFWHDHKSAKINTIRTRKCINDSDIVVVRFGEQYKQWNAAFDAGYASALGKSIIVIHNEDHQHALKEVNAAAVAVASNQAQVVRILKYVLSGSLK